MTEVSFTVASALSVRHFAPGEELSDPRPGDFILTHGGEFFSHLIRFGQQLRFRGRDNPFTYWNHVALIVSTEGDIIEALGSGVMRRSLADYQPTQYTVVRIDASPADRAEVVAFAERFVGLPYGAVTNARIALASVTGCTLTFGVSGQFVCAGLVARALERTSAIFAFEPSQMTPADLAKIYRALPPEGVAPKGRRARRADARLAAGAATSPKDPRGAPVRWTSDFVLVAASDPIRELVPRLLREERPIVVTRFPKHEPGHQYVYAYRPQEISYIAHSPPETSFEVALGLHEAKSVPTGRSTQSTVVNRIVHDAPWHGTPWRGVVLNDDGQPVTVGFEEPAHEVESIRVAPPESSGVIEVTAIPGFWRERQASVFREPPEGSGIEVGRDISGSNPQVDPSDRSPRPRDEDADEADSSEKGSAWDASVPAPDGSDDSGSSGRSAGDDVEFDQGDAGDFDSSSAPPDEVPAQPAAADRGGFAHAAPPSTPVAAAESSAETAGAEPPVAANGGGGVMAPPVAEEDDPPRSAYGFIDAPDRVVAGEEFTVRVGLDRQAQAGVAGGEMVRPSSSRGPYDLDIQIIATGFEIRAGESWRRVVRITAKDAYPKFPVHLHALESNSVSWRTIEVKFSIGGHVIGFAIRTIAVASARPELPRIVIEEQDSHARFDVPVDDQPADLTVTIKFTDRVTGDITWAFDADPALGLTLPQAATDPILLGKKADAFALELMTEMNASEGRPGLYNNLLGVGKTIAHKVPAEFWPLLAAISRKARDRSPTILFLSEDPYVPWELAALVPPYFRDPLPDPAAPPFLSAQVAVGRWALDLQNRDNPRPKPLPPAAAKTVTKSVVISGDYRRTPGWNPLPESVAEAAALAIALPATAVDAETTAVIKALEDSAANVIHFACHGQFDPNGSQSGFFLADGLAFRPNAVMSVDLTGTPFVFLNACQVGQGRQVLGDYSGMAHAFLFAGACGVIAPLWSINDKIARELAARFYPKVFDEGIAPAAVLRTERINLKDTVDSQSGTWLAYQFFGHPRMRLQRTAS